MMASRHYSLPLIIEKSHWVWRHVYVYGLFAWVWAVCVRGHTHVPVLCMQCVCACMADWLHGCVAVCVSLSTSQVIKWWRRTKLVYTHTHTNRVGGGSRNWQKIRMYKHINITAPQNTHKPSRELSRLWQATVLSHSHGSYKHCHTSLFYSWKRWREETDQGKGTL